jgi:hypothetical protein
VRLGTVKGEEIYPIPWSRDVSLEFAYCVPRCNKTVFCSTIKMFGFIIILIIIIIKLFLCKIRGELTEYQELPAFLVLHVILTKILTRSSLYGICTGRNALEVST